MGFINKLMTGGGEWHGSHLGAAICKVRTATSWEISEKDGALKGNIILLNGGFSIATFLFEHRRVDDG